MKNTAKQRTEVALPQDLKRDLRVYCAKNDMTLRLAVITAVKKFISADESKDGKQKS